jgi:2-dehydro-3-deoxyphosphogluconate aldolase/(4S)-4-hydroxy-2-oxoglutarate aldolase
LNELAKRRLVPVLALDDAGQAADLAEALVAGGLPVAEVTFRTGAAVQAIQAMAARGDMLVGAGTVLSPEQVDAAAEAGAAFVVSPGTSQAVLTRAVERGLAALPGAVTATEVQQLLELGVEAMKFFPAETSGGAAAIKALGGPFKHVKFIPTGGIGPGELARYLSLPNVLAVGGSWMAPAGALAAGDFDQIRRLTAEAVALAEGARRP